MFHNIAGNVSQVSRGLLIRLRRV